MVVRGIEGVLGLWLCVSAFLWPHGIIQFLNAALVGLAVIAAAAMAALARERVRHAATALAVWLFLSNLLLPGTGLATAWNHAVVAVAVFLLSMVPSTPGRRTRAAV